MLLKPTSSAPEPLQTTTKFNVYTEDSVQLQTTPSKPSLASSAHDSRHEEHMSLSIPTVRLDTQNISSAMASRLATSVLCHVLFLKGQIPFPVVQLSRMPGAQSNTRAGKKREELINAVDTLSSHLQTTFTALSAALARRQKRHDTPRHCVENTVALGRAYIAYVLGPSVGAAKARVVFAVDGLEVKEQGTGVEVQQLSTEFRDDKAEAEGAQPSGEFHTEHSTVEDSGSQSGSESEEEPSNTSEDSEEENDDAATPPPPSRSPSPSPPSSPLPNALLNTPPPALPDSVAKSSLSIQPFVDSDTETPVQPSSKLLSENTSPLAMRQRLKPSSPLAEKQTPRSILPASHALSENTSPLPTHQHKPASPLVSKTPARHALAFASLALSENTPPAPRRGLGQRAFGTPLATSSSPASKPALAPAPSQTREAEQQALRAADRLLSRTLANACAEGDGGLSAELASTQTHVLLRAPRSFAHPAWVPRQNLTRTLDSQLHAFLEDIVVPPPSDAADDQAPQKLRKKVRTGVKTEGVWVCAKDGPRDVMEGLGEAQSEERAEVSEEDEMIWWVWEGKIAGFSEW